MFEFNKTLETDKILLRPLVIEDLEKFVLLTKDKNMWYYFTHDLSDRDDLEDWVNTAIKQMEKKTRLTFTIIDKETKNIIGSSSFGNILEQHKCIEIGWTWISKKYQGKKINNKVKYLMMKYCFEELKFERVEFKTDVLNTFARKALSRIGATEEGILRNHMYMTNNRRRDSIYYSVLISEWENIKTTLGKYADS